MNSLSSGRICWLAQGETVQVETEKTARVTGKISGLEPDGSLKIRNEHGEFVTVRFGDVRLRPLA